MISSWHSSLFTACIIALLHSSTFAAGNGKDSLLHDYLVKYCTYKNIPSIAAGMNVQGNTVWMDATGLADIENNVPATVNSVYRVASVSKVITSVAVMQLVEAGKIKLDEDVRTYIPQYPRKRWKFTIRQVLEHTSGLRTYKDGEFDSKTPFRNSTEVLNYLAADTLMYEPGTKYLYSSLSFNLLASVIESVTGMPFTQYMQKNIFDRADMRQTCYDEVAKIVPNRVAGYDKNGLRAFENAPLADLSIKFPGGGVLSTVPDLLKFGHALLSGKFFSIRYLDTMTAPVRLKNGSLTYYGLGLGTWQDDKNRPRCGHTGGGTGFVSQLTLLPKEHVVVVHLINCRDRNMGNPVEDIITLAINNGKVLLKKTLSDAFMLTYRKHGLDSALTALSACMHDSLALYDTSSADMMALGNDMIAAGLCFPAARMLATMAEFQTGNDALLILCGDAFLKDGNRGLALRHYRKALGIKPSNTALQKKIKDIETQK